MPLKGLQLSVLVDVLQPTTAGRLHGPPDPDAHLAAIEAYETYLKCNQPKRRHSA